MALPSEGQVLITRQDVHHDVSPALRDLVNAAPALPVTTPREAEALRLLPLPDGFKPATEPDPVRQRTAVAAPVNLAPAVINNFDGIGQDVPPGFIPCCVPPDTNGAVGLTQYVQWVNLSFAVFDKTTTNITLGPAPGNTLWTGFGGSCETNNDGDPVVTYDKLANRWVFTQFVVLNPTPPPFFGPFLQCVAVSTTPDATGTYNRYAFSYSNFDDYPKISVWPDAYYITFNMFTPSGSAFVGADACAYDRNAMLAGLPATQVCFQQGSSVGGMLPADLDGHTPPPPGSPNYLMTFGANSLNLYKFHVDFVTPANSTFTGPTVIPVAPFTPLCTPLDSCVPQPGDPTLLDSLSDRLMYRLAYRNFTDHESLVVNHTVAVNLSSGVRWYEIQNPGGTPVVAQQSTFAPDDSFRWMGSIAMDSAGDIALGYSVSSSSVFPSIAFTGRSFSDPSSTMGAETAIVAGTGVQAGVNRWGDYSAMQVDPGDDCTFWYTTEYQKVTGGSWNTRIANFRFPGCQAPDLTIALTHTGNFTQGQTGASYTITVKNSGSQSTAGTVTVTDTLPAKLTATAASGTGWTCTVGATTTCTRSDVLASGSSYPPIILTVNVAADAPGSITNTVTTAGGGDADPNNNTASDPATIIQKGPDPAITKIHAGNFTQGQTGSYTITVTNTGLSPTDGTAVTVTDTLPAGLTAAAAAGTGWTCAVGVTTTCSRSNVLASNAAYPPITLTVNVAGTAPALVVNSATVAGGGDVNALNNAASDPTAVLPPPADLTITKSHTGNFHQGQQRTSAYTITVTNQAGAGATRGLVTVTDILPAGLSVVFMSGPGWACSPSSLTCLRFDVLAAGASYPAITLSVKVAGNAPGSVTNTATVSGGGDVTPGNNSASDPTTILPSPDLTVALSHTPDPFTVGQSGTYTITASNVGTAATSGPVTVSDFLPSSLTATAVIGAGWNCSGTTSITCTRSDALAAGGSYPPITVTVSIGNSTPSVTNSAVVSGGGEFNLLNNSASDLTNINTPTLAITKTHTGSFTVGQPGAYTITVSNTGKIATIGTVTLNDFMPFGLTATAASGAGWLCSALPSTFVNCTRADALAPLQSYPPLTLTVNVSGGGPAVTNTASVTGGGDSLIHNASDLTTIIAPVLAIAKTHTGNFTVGQPGTYQITVSNTGAIPTVGTVSVNDFLPFGMIATAISGTGWNCSPPPTSFVNCTRSNSLAVNGSYPAIAVTVSIGDSAPSVTNTASVTGGGDTNIHTANDPTTVITPVLAITKTHVGDFTVGQPGAYTITVSNTGTIATAGTVTVTDSLPSGLVATAVSGAGWNCPVVPTTFLNCTRSDALASLQSYPPLTINVSVNGGGPSATNSASVTGGGDGLSHSASDLTKINAPVLAITKTHVGNFAAGQIGTYHLKVSNTGVAATLGTVTVNDFLPGGMTAVAITAPGWTCPVPPATNITCTRSDALAINSSYPEITLAVSLGDSASLETNSASVSGGGDLAFHSASDLTTISAPVLAITMSHPGDFTTGLPGSYTIQVSNTGTLATLGTVTVTDSLPSGMAATTASGAGWSCSALPSNFVKCNRADALHPGQSYPPLTFGVSVNSADPIANNFAQVSGGGSISQNVSDLTNVNTPSLSITKMHTGVFTVGQPAAFTITVGNNGAAATFGTVTVNDFVPFGMTLTAASGPGWSCTTGFGATCTRSDALAPGGVYPAITLTVNLNSGGLLTNSASLNGGGDPRFYSASDSVNVNAPALVITKSHPGDFTLGQPGTYTITVRNTGTLPTSGTVTVTDFLPFGMSATATAGAGWSCSGVNVVTCTRADALAAGSSYPALTVTVNVTAGGTVINTANVTGGGDSSFHSANDLTNISAPVLAIAKSHAVDPFVVGSQGTYSITVSNVGTVATTGTVTVTDSLPQGMTIAASSGTGWSCSGVTSLNCTRADALAANSSYPTLTLTVNVGDSAPSVTNTASVSGGGDAAFHNASDFTNITAPNLAITKTHSGNFTVGQNGIYTITVSNKGTVATTGTVTVSDFLPFSMSAISTVGTGWTCSGLSFVTCTRSDALAPAGSFPPITLTVSVSGGQSSTVNSASVTGGGDGVTHQANDPTNIITPILGVTMTHIGNFTLGQPGIYTITVSNTGTIPTSGAVTISDSLPQGLTAAAVNAVGWNCSFLPNTFFNCSRSDSLAGGASYSAITLTVSLDPSVQAVVNHQVTVIGGGDSNNHTAIDPTIINLPDLAITSSHPGDFTVGQPANYTITVSNAGAIPTSGTGTITVDDFIPGGLTATAASGTGWTCSLLSGPPQQMQCTRTADVLTPGNSYPSITLSVTPAIDAPSPVTNAADVFGINESNFANNSALDSTVISGFRFVPVTPCRIADTRNPNGPFGGPFIAGNTTRGFAIPGSACNIPVTAQAYSLNVTVVPKGPLGFLTMFPCGQPLPLASTLNSLDGRIKAGAAIIPAGTAGAVCAFASNDTELVLDINGYFVPAATPASLAFYPVAPCRVADTRLATGPLGGPALAGQAARTFPILSSACNIPATAQAYSLNYTSVPNGPLGFLTTWPAGQTQPLVSTLNALTGAITANAAIVPAGTNGDISVFVTNSSNLVIDIDGYFAPPGPGGLSLFPLTPCRVLDTRNPAGAPPFNGTISLNVVTTPCAPPPSSQAFVLNATVVPPGPLGFLTLWPQGSVQPLVSTLNAIDGAITSNMAIVPTSNGSISAFGSNPVHLVLDITAFFAP